MITEVQKNDSFSLVLKKKKMKKLQEKIPLSTKEGYIFVNPEDIIRCGANKKNSICILKNNVQQELLLSLKEMEAILKNHDFFRVHHANLVNINHIEKYKKERNAGGSLTMSTGEIVCISKRKKIRFLRFLKQ